jgi:hypothetical protein
MAQLHTTGKTSWIGVVLGALWHHVTLCVQCHAWLGICHWCVVQTYGRVCMMALHAHQHALRKLNQSRVKPHLCLASLLLLLLLPHVLLLPLLLLLHLLQTLLDPFCIPNGPHFHGLWDTSTRLVISTCILRITPVAREGVCHTPGDPPAAGSV